MFQQFKSRFILANACKRFEAALYTNQDQTLDRLSRLVFERRLQTDDQLGKDLLTIWTHLKSLNWAVKNDVFKYYFDEDKQQEAKRFKNLLNLPKTQQEWKSYLKSMQQTYFEVFA